jgi:pimeloyl-ACP methyl ester carboxylesterase
MLHGWPVDHRHMVKDFEPLFEHRDGWKRLYPDMPGMGQTKGADWIESQDQMLAILLEFIDTVIPEQQFCLAGTSYGGYLAQGVVRERSSQMSGLFLMTPAQTMDGTKRVLPPNVTLVRDDELISEMEPNEAEFFEEFAVVQSRALLESLRRDVFPAFEIADHGFLDNMENSIDFSFDITALPETFNKPSLILLGRQDSNVGYSDAWQILENYPRATFVVLDRAGHGLGVEQRQLFLALASEWLDRVEESIRLNNE